MKLASLDGEKKEELDTGVDIRAGQKAIGH
jgi:hypothetical protein